MSATKENSDTIFMASIIQQICDYSRKNGMSPDESIKTVAENMLALLEIATFEHWENKSDEIE